MSQRQAWPLKDFVMLSVVERKYLASQGTQQRRVPVRKGRGSLAQRPGTQGSSAHWCAVDLPCSGLRLHVASSSDARGSVWQKVGGVSAAQTATTSLKRRSGSSAADDPFDL